MNHQHHHHHHHHHSRPVPHYPSIIPSAPPINPVDRYVLLSDTLKRLQTAFNSLLSEQDYLLRALQAATHGMLTDDEVRELTNSANKKRAERMTLQKVLEQVLEQQKWDEWHANGFGRPQEVQQHQMVVRWGTADSEMWRPGGVGDPFKKKMRLSPTLGKREVGWVQTGSLVDGRMQYQGEGSKGMPGNRDTGSFFPGQAKGGIDDLVL